MEKYLVIWAFGGPSGGFEWHSVGSDVHVAGAAVPHTPGHTTRPQPQNRQASRQHAITHNHPPDLEAPVPDRPHPQHALALQAPAQAAHGSAGPPAHGPLGLGAPHLTVDYPDVERQPAAGLPQRGDGGGEEAADVGGDGQAAGAGVWGAAEAVGPTAG
jgi:hypothetical protein